MKCTYTLLLITLTYTFINGCCDRPSKNLVKTPMVSELNLITKELSKQSFSNEKNIEFKVKYYAEKENWACLCVESFVWNKFMTEPFWDLFMKDNLGWHRIDWSKDMTFEDDFELLDLPVRNSKIAKRIVKKFPDCPMDIFPIDKDNEVLP
jgi:hypothetical protein